MELDYPGVGLYGRRPAGIIAQRQQGAFLADFKASMHSCHELRAGLLNCRQGCLVNDQVSDWETKILAVLQEGFPDSQTPFRDIAQRVGIDVDELLCILQRWKQEGKIRRVGAIVNHAKVGFGAGALVAWQVEPERVGEVGRILAGFGQVSHAYERETPARRGWAYNVYSMVHAANDDELVDTIERMSKTCGISSYRVLITERELKKAPPRYVAGQ